MAMDYFNPAEAFKAGYAATEAVSTDIQSKDILRQAYAGQPPGGEANTGNPATDTEVYAKAARLAGMQGNASLAHSFTKQATDSAALTGEMKLNQVKAAQASLGMASQYAEAATSQEDLYKAIDMSGADEQTRMYLRGAIRTMPLDQAKATLKKVSMTVEQNLKAEQLAITGASQRTSQDNIENDNLIARINLKQRDGTELTPEEEVFKATGVLPKYQRQGKVTGTTTGEAGADASSTGRGAAESGDDYSAVNKASGAMGRYQIMPDTLKSLRKLDPTLPKTDDEFLKSPAAQDKAMKLLEAEDKKSLKADGFKDSKVNLATYHRFGAGDGKKVLNAFEDNPSTSLKEALGEDRYNKIIAQNPDLKDKTVSQAITQNFGVGSKAAAAPTEGDKSLTDLYDRKRGGGLTVKEWDTINPTAVQIGKEYQIKPSYLANATTEEKKAANAAYKITQKAEDTAQFIKDHRQAVGTLAAITKAAGSKTGNLFDNISADKRYTGDVAELGKRLFTQGLNDAASSAGGRLNQYLERSFANLYDQSQSPETLLRIIKERQSEGFDVLNDTYGADKEKLNKDKYKLAFSPDINVYLSGDKKDSATSTSKPKADINTFFRTPLQGGGDSFSSKLETLGQPK